MHVKLLIFGNKDSLWEAKLWRRDVLLKEYLWMARATIHHNTWPLFIWKSIHALKLKEMLNAGLLGDKACSSKVMKRPNMRLNSLCCYCARLNLLLSYFAGQFTSFLCAIQEKNAGWILTKQPFILSFFLSII